MTLLVGCMMATNAADLLPVSLSSLRANVDELILVDGGSTDATPSIARNLGAVVVDSLWQSHSGRQRQVYLDAALRRYGGRDDVWVMVLDSDEVILGGQLRPVVEDLRRAGIDHGRLPRMWIVSALDGLDYIDSKPHHPDYQLRLFRLQQGLRYSGVTHEVLHGLGPGRDLVAPTIVHLVLLRADVAQRSDKVRDYERLEPGSGVPRFYLPEKYGFTLKPLPIDEAVRPYLPAIDRLTRVRLTQRDLRGKSIKYRLTWPLVDLWEWGQLKARRGRRRLLRAARRKPAG